MLRRDLSGATGSAARLAPADARPRGRARSVRSWRRQLDRIGALVAAAEDCPARRPEAIRTRLGEQVAALVAASGALDPQRLHQEAVMIATRADIREELDRLASPSLYGAGASRFATEPVGRRLDFLAQEFGREANTLCAKANDVSLSRIGLDLKERDRAVPRAGPERGMRPGEPRSADALRGAAGPTGLDHDPVVAVGCRQDDADAAPRGGPRTRPDRIGLRHDAGPPLVGDRESGLPLHRRRGVRATARPRRASSNGPRCTAITTARRADRWSEP